MKIVSDPKRTHAAAMPVSPVSNAPDIDRETFAAKREELTLTSESDELEDAIGEVALAIQGRLKQPDSPDFDALCIEKARSIFWNSFKEALRELNGTTVVKGDAVTVSKSDLDRLISAAQARSIASLEGDEAITIRSTPKFNFADSRVSVASKEYGKLDFAAEKEGNPLAKLCYDAIRAGAPKSVKFREGDGYWEKGQNRQGVVRRLCSAFSGVIESLSSKQSVETQTKWKAIFALGLSKSSPQRTSDLNSAIESAVKEEVTGAETAIGLRKGAKEIKPQDENLNLASVAVYTLAGTRLFHRVNAALSHVAEAMRSTAPVRGGVSERVSERSNDLGAKQKAERPQLTKAAILSETIEALSSLDKGKRRMLPPTVAAELMLYDSDQINDRLEAQILVTQALGIVARSEGLTSLRDPISEGAYKKAQWLIINALEAGDFEVPASGAKNEPKQRGAAFHKIRKVWQDRESERDAAIANSEVAEFRDFAENFRAAPKKDAA